MQCLYGLYFFFQAEDGIRDYKVTGVQTCALPIWVYQKLSVNGGVGLALGRDIDLRIFFAQWHAGYAVTEQPAQAGRPAMRSLQFFNAQGRAVHKVHARESTDLQAWEARSEEHTSELQSPCNLVC